jgi:signal transduction histidine kinase
MSLRRRLVVVLVLALSALVIAVLAIVHVLATTDKTRERTAEANADAGAMALAERVDPASLHETPGGEARRQLQSTAASVLRPVANAVGGYCTRRGTILAVAGKGQGFREGGRRPLPPEVEDAVASMCSKARPGEPIHGRIERAREVDLLATVAVGDQGAAWFYTRLRGRDGEESPAWPFEVVLLAVAAVALAAFTIDAMMALGGGARELSGALVRLQEDLRAPVPRPRARELGDIAAGLSAMAAHLADARDRERALESTLAREQRLAALGRVVAGVAHEVRNPLAGMKLRLDLLARSRGLGGGEREDVAACLGEVARLNRLVESLLTVSRAKTQVLEPLELGALVDERIAGAAAHAGKARVRLGRIGDARVTSDHDALAGAIDNLLRNAVDASPAGGFVAVRIGAEDGAVVLDVEDPGPGIPEARRAELFEPFFTTKPEGTGLGLWISRLLLEAKGASLRYDRVGDKTRMRIAFASRA